MEKGLLVCQFYQKPIVAILDVTKGGVLVNSSQFSSFFLFWEPIYGLPARFGNFSVAALTTLNP
jgi:hypothetical protein